MSTIERARSRSRFAAIAVAMLIVLVTLVTPLSAAPAASAAPGPDTSISGPYISWDVRSSSDVLMEGATFEVQRSQQTSYWWFGTRWNDFGAWSTIATVADCTASGCATSGDRDTDGGEFQLTSGVLTNTSDTRYRYRIRAVDSISGPQMQSTAWSAETRVIDWPGTSFDLGTFAAALRPALSCTTGTVYSVLENGTVRQITFSGNSSSVTTFGGWTGASADQVNSLGIGANGGVMYALVRGNDASGRQLVQVESILRYTPAGGWQTLPGSDYPTGNNQALVAGAVSLTTGEYYFGGPHSLGNGSFTFRLHKFNPATGVSSFVGTIATGQTVAANGDIAFDAAGNLLLIQSVDNSSTSTVVPASALAAANGGALQATTAPGGAFGTSINGISYDGDSTLFAGTGTTIRRYDTATWTQSGTTATNIGLNGVSSTDLAGCISPVTVTVQKVVNARGLSTDQFTLSIRQGTTGAVRGTVTTTGSQTGLQAERIVGITVPTSAAYTITETMASGTAANYASSWSCTSNGAAFASGTGTTIALTTPPTPGANVVCTFSNSTLVSTITVRKTMQDVDGQNAVARPQWTVGARITSGAQQVGAITTSNQSTDNDGAASWTVRHTSTSTNATVLVSEAQQLGFEFVGGYCDVTALGGAPVRTAIASAGGRELAFAPGSTVACVFTNKVKPTTLTLVKQVTSGTAPTSLFALAATAPTGAPSGTLAGPTGASGTDATTNARITPGVAYRLSESGGPATYVQVGSWTCVDQSGAAVAVTAAGDMTAAQGSEVTCTVRNGIASLVLLQTVEGSSALQPNQFTLRATPTAFTGGTLTATTRTGSAQVAGTTPIEVRPGHGYALESTSTAAHIGLRLECYTGPGSTTCFSGTTAPTAAQLADQANWRSQTSTTAVVAANGTAYYRFVATSPTPFTLPITGGIGADQIQLLGAGLAAIALLTGLGILLHRRRRAA